MVPVFIPSPTKQHTALESTHLPVPPPLPTMKDAISSAVYEHVLHEKEDVGDTSFEDIERTIAQAQQTKVHFRLFLD